MITGKWQALDNTDRGEKLEIRKRLLSALKNPSVLDCFAGEGKIYKTLYKNLPYVGIDKKPINDGRVIINIDNVKYLRSADLSGYNFFDLDAYGSPWHQFLIIMKRRKIIKNQTIAIALTDGLKLIGSLSDLPHGLKPYIGMPKEMRIPFLHLHLDFIRACLVSRICKECGCIIKKSYSAQNKKGNMTYLGLLLNKT